MASNRRTRTPARNRKPAPVADWEQEVAETVTRVRAADFAVVRDDRIKRARRRDRKALDSWKRSYA